MRLVLIAMLIAAASLAGCEMKSESEGYLADAKYETTTTTETPASAPAADAAAAGLPAPPEQPAPTTGPTSVAAMVAYVYGYTLNAPQKAVRGMISRHEALCRAAGPATCQVIGSNISEEGDYQLRAHLELRASPAWTARFRGGLAADVEKSEGRIVSSAVESEDLSRTIIDTGARLRAMTTLRDRLQALLASRPGKLGELIEIERELARVQGEIDSAQSQLTYAQGRVATSTINLNYRSRDPLAAQGVWSPLAEAFGDFVGLIVGVIALLIRTIAVLLPLALLAWLALWLFRKPIGAFRERRGTERAEKRGRKKASAP